MPRAVVIAVVGLLAFPAVADAPVHALRDWQAKRIVRANAALLNRPDFRVERTVRLTAQSVRVCWSEPGYLGPDDGRDFGCDVVQMRGTQFWLLDDAMLGAGWVRWL